MRAENAYKNLDDHKKYFLMPMKGDFQQAMVILTCASLCFMACLAVMLPCVSLYYGIILHFLPMIETKSVKKRNK